MTVPARISIVTLGVADLARSVSFYEALGWVKAAASNDDIVWFHTADSALGLYRRAALAEDAALPAEPTAPFGGVTLAINLESREAVDAAMAHAESCGATVLKPQDAVFWGGYSGYFADPDGHPWEVAHNPYVSFDGSGRMLLD